MDKSLSTKSFYRPELDALRFFAFFAVFCFHLMDYVNINPATHPILNNFCTAGAFGVPIFFLLSSFLIVELLLRERAVTQTVHIKSFYTRRILRIWPLYFVVFYGLVILGHYLPDIAPQNYQAWFAFTFFAGNWYILQHGWIAGPIDPLWSIAVEEQFYIAIPLLARFGGKKLLTIISVLLLLIALIVNIHYAKLKYSGESGQWVNSLFQFQFFAAGALLAIIAKGRMPSWNLLIRLIVFVIAISCWYFAVSKLGVRSYDGHPTIAGAITGWLLVLLGAVLFLLSALGLNQQYVPRFLIYLGRISFGLYMFHSLIFHLVFITGKTYLCQFLTVMHLPASFTNFAGILITLLSTFIMAAFSYRFFERPFLKLKQKFTFIPSRQD